MPAATLPLDEQHVFNQCAKYLVRSVNDARHDFGHLPPGDARVNLCEPWRFPLIDGHYDEVLGQERSYGYNEVTFVWRADAPTPPQRVSVVGTFAPLYESTPLVRIGDSRTWAACVRVPKGEVHRYRFVVDGQPVVDPINPQSVVLDNGQRWSRFFTHQCTAALTFEPWEQELLGRLTAHVLPFRTRAAENFTARHLAALDREARTRDYPHAYRLEQPVGVVNFIDKLLAREEAHHAYAYHECLRQVARLLEASADGLPIVRLSSEEYDKLFHQLAGADGTPGRELPGWNHARYANPSYFVKLLRRHTLTGAFAHPKYGGNAAGIAWAFLEERYRDEHGKTLFDWRKAVEWPLGQSRAYRG